MDKIDIVKMVKSNPDVNMADLGQYRALLKKLRRSGVKRSEYRLVSPYAGRHVSVYPGIPPKRIIELRSSSERI